MKFQSISHHLTKVEAAFRGMQMSFGRDKVTPGCYLAFFDNVAEFVASIPIKLEQPDTLIPDRSCLSNEPTTLQHDTGSNVPLIDLATMAMHASLGANVAFLDTRESWEFDEGHIPGALNMPLRDITASSVAELLDKDLVQDIQTAMSNMRIKLVKGLTHTQAVLFRIKIAIFR